MSKIYPCPNDVENDCGFPACAHAMQCERAAKDRLAPTTGWASHTPDDARELAEAGHAACGHAALAAALGISVRKVLPYFIKQGGGLWVSEKRMKSAIVSAGFYWDDIGLPWPPITAVVWLQGLGSWMNPGVPIGARNQRTHWIATGCDAEGTLCVYDINLGDWVPRVVWRRDMLPDLLFAWKAKDYGVRMTLAVRPNDMDEGRRTQEIETTTDAL